MVVAAGTVAAESAAQVKVDIMARESAVAVSIRFIIITPDFIYITGYALPIKKGDSQSTKSRLYIANDGCQRTGIKGIFCKISMTSRGINNLQPIVKYLNSLQKDKKSSSNRAKLAPNLLLKNKNN